MATQGGTTLGSEVEDKVWAAKDGELVGPVKIAAAWHWLCRGHARGRHFLRASAHRDSPSPSCARSVRRRGQGSGRCGPGQARPSPARVSRIFSRPRERREGQQERRYSRGGNWPLFASWRYGSGHRTCGHAGQGRLRAVEARHPGRAIPRAGQLHRSQAQGAHEADMAEFEKEKQRLADDAAQRKAQIGRDGLGAAAVPGGQGSQEDRREPGSAAIRGRAGGRGVVRALLAAEFLRIA